MNRRRFLKRSAVVGATFVGATPLGIPWLPSCRAAHAGPLRPLRKLYLSMHSLCWADCVASDPRRKTPRWEQFDGRCELAYRKDLEVEKRLHRLIRAAMPDEGFLIVPNGLNNEPEKRMIALAREHFGDRCAVDDGRTDEGFDRGLDEDLRQTVLQRGPQWENPQSLPPGREFEAWRGAKRMAVALQAILLEQGYSFDPQTVEMESFGDDWMGCAATYPIQIAGAWGLAKGVDRRFDLGISDESPLFLKVEPVEQNLPMPENVRLFLFKTPDEPPTGGPLHRAILGGPPPSPRSTSSGHRRFPGGQCAGNQYLRLGNEILPGDDGLEHVRLVWSRRNECWLRGTHPAPFHARDRRAIVLGVVPCGAVGRQRGQEAVLISPHGA